VHTEQSVLWSSYDRWEGPVVYGKCPYTVDPKTATWNERVMHIVSATEGNLDSVNMYDRAICSVGVIQFTELTNQNVSNMLGAVAEKAPQALSHLTGVMKEAGVTFAKKPTGFWRFRRGDAWFDGVDQMRHLFLRGAGLRGTWGPEQRAYAKRWCASIANVFTSLEAQRVQVDFTASRIESFALEPARRLLWDGTNDGNDGYHGAIRAAFQSYAINLPAVASKCALSCKSTAPKWSEAWAIDMLRTFVVDSKVAIWPDRYDRIRPRLESHFAVNLPDFAEDLRAASDGLDSIRAIQRALLKLGFDPGPIDGVWGAKSKAAVRDYQRARGLEDDGHVGPITRAKLRFDLDANMP